MELLSSIKGLLSRRGLLFGAGVLAVGASAAERAQAQSAPSHLKFSNPEGMFKPAGYTHVVEVTGPGRTVYIAGQLGLDIDNKLVGGPGDFGAQCERAFENLGHALAAVGATFADVVKINNYLVDMAHIGLFRLARDKHFDMKAPPASTTVAISQLARPGALFEIEAIAVLPPAKPRSKAAARGGARQTKKKSRRR